MVIYIIISSRIKCWKRVCLYFNVWYILFWEVILLKNIRMVLVVFVIILSDENKVIKYNFRVKKWRMCIIWISLGIVFFFVILLWFCLLIVKLYSVVEVIFWVVKDENIFFLLSMWISYGMVLVVVMVNLLVLFFVDKLINVFVVVLYVFSVFCSFY